jgi:pyridoxal phosphate enzyme, YggS family
MVYESLVEQIRSSHAQLVAVSKTKAIDAIMTLYNKGQRDFGENKVQELVQKYKSLPKDIRWHLIGHLQRNKVKYIVSFVHLIHSVDSLALMYEINKEAIRHHRVVDVLLQIHIAKEETKFGLSKEELVEILEAYVSSPSPFSNIRICGLMGMSSLTEDDDLRRKEFISLKELFDFCKNGFFPLSDTFNTLSMGMSDDYNIALACGSNMIRIGSLLFGKR